ncbi:MAG: hypothetical protein MJ151_04275, partial [Lachnospiraceae bacterium]|nr:hypothetical protein [Lachnospiraceae bacterium]
NQDALNKQIATLDPSNLEIYDTTNRLLAEQEQISHAQGLNDNAYRVSDAEVATLNQAKQTALTIDFTSIGLYICQGIANGINANKYLVIDAVKSMMAEANSAAKKEEDINSPSKVFMKYGYFMDKGLELGIKNNADGPINNLRDMMASMNSVAAGKLSGLGENVSNTIKSANSAMNGYNGENGVNKSQVNYTFNQYNTSNKSLDVLSIYKESRSLLRREIRSQYV